MKKAMDKKKDHGTQIHKLDAITFLVCKIWSHSSSATRSYGRQAGRQNKIFEFLLCLTKVQHYYRRTNKF